VSAPRLPGWRPGASTRAESARAVVRLGILGGTFNPPHLGHVALAEHARAQLGLARVLLMPAHSAPHKREQPDPGPVHRLRMCRLAVTGVPGVTACALEIERGGPSYTVDTLRSIHADHPNAELTFIVGADTARTLPGWREPEQLLELARLAVVEREGVSGADVLRALAGLTPGRGRAADGGAEDAADGREGSARDEGARVAFLEMPAIDISSSTVRARVARGEPVDGLVGPAVASYIDRHGLYGAGRKVGAR
jgi:nicotinate-nucleotide adenylyltransferase